MASASQGEKITIVRTLDDFQRAATIRAIVYMDGQACPYDEEFDGNDFCGMHLLGWVDGEPAASLRLRFFGGFAKLERLAVRPEHRRSSIAFRIVREALALARRKGFPKAYGHAREGLEPFWARFGATLMGPAGGFAFSGHRYTEMVVELSAGEDTLRLGEDPLVLIRPEGEWDRPGVLERAEPDAWSDDVRSAWAPWAGGRMPGLEEESACFLDAPRGSSGIGRDGGARHGVAERRQAVRQPREGAALGHRRPLRHAIHRWRHHDAPAARRRRFQHERGRPLQLAQIAGPRGARHRLRQTLGTPSRIAAALGPLTLSR